MQLDNVVIRDVETAAPGMPLIEVARRMHDRALGFLPVVEDGKLLGVVTDRDIVVRCVAQGMDAVTMTTREIMSVEVVCCFEDEQAEHARNLMHERGVRRLPIIDREHRLVGLVRLPDIEGGQAPRSRSMKVVFHKEKTDSYGRPHKVAVKTVYITGAHDKAGAEAAAVKTVEDQEGTTWTNVATGFETTEEPGSPKRDADLKSER